MFLFETILSRHHSGGDSGCWSWCWTRGVRRKRSNMWVQIMWVVTWQETVCWCVIINCRRPTTRRPEARTRTDATVSRQVGSCGCTSWRQRFPWWQKRILTSSHRAPIERSETLITLTCIVKQVVVIWTSLDTFQSCLQFTNTFRHVRYCRCLVRQLILQIPYFTLLKWSWLLSKQRSKNSFKFSSKREVV